VFQLTGVRVRETIPDWAVRQAAEIVMVDVTPRALLHRLERGVVYSREKAPRALDHFFRESTLVALRELALRETAHEVEHRTEPRPPASRDRLLILVTADPIAAMVIRRAKRVADFLGAECFAVAVEHPEHGPCEATERHLNFARNLHVETSVLRGHDIAAALFDFARRNRITQVYVARPQSRPLGLRLSVVQKVVALARAMQVVVVAER
jgi:two-component system, OmpR family, sensor histidine kinase KdpD